jgi:hypothetical protein
MTELLREFGDLGRRGTAEDLVGGEPTADDGQEPAPLGWQHPVQDVRVQAAQVLQYVEDWLLSRWTR